MHDYECITLERDGDVMTITLNRPEKMNAATPKMFDEIRDALGELKSEGVRCLLLTGNGRAFCAGADLGGGLADHAPGDAVRQSLQKHYNPALLALHALDIPVVAAVNGAAAGIGCSLALSADLIFASRSAYFLQAFVNIGLVPDGGSTWLLSKSAGSSRAMKMMLTGDRLSAETAEKIGLINYFAEDDALLSDAMAMAQRLACGPTLALGMIRQLARAAEHMGLEEVLNAEAEAQKLVGDSEDFAEGVAAFREKRAPIFKGR